MVRKFLGYSRLERRLVVQAWLALTLVRILLWVLPYRRVEAWLIKPAAQVPGRATPAEIARSITRASTLVPAATCLVQALAGSWLIRRAGGIAELRFGVAKDHAGFKAHAWLEGEGRILIGGRTAADYSMLAPADDGRR